ncbi:baseplate J/gp47 family protein [Polaromonas sp. JS666]|uniref:baseplate J/gp47 family protein n=1 Tax=Polaromonas sp. (strain JS666 / ATCC BAA-500) TaxID=296591 RepID=UPI0000464B6A|nr:baseplate J/gp47 family protein [Polaromonas sp. JS666]ABE45632.1 Baseplate J-like protein [Polaromonas sp. JS666]
MAFTRPSLLQIIERNIADIETRLPGTDARLRRSNLNVIARMLAGAVHGLYGVLDYLSRQVIIDTADAEYLSRWASIWGVNRKAAARAIGPVTFTGLTGSTVPAGTVLSRADGAEFTVDADATLVAGTATGQLTASVAGAAGNTAAVSALTFVTPVAGVNTGAVVAAGGLVNGSDTEDDASLRERLLARIQETPQGGADFDYVNWAKAVAGVTDAWCYPQELGPGSVTVRFMRYDDTVTGIPDAAEVAAVQAYIDARRPVTAAVTVVAPVAVPLNFTITLTPNTLLVKNAVQAELTDLIRREAVPGGTLLLSHIREAISLAAGETNYVMTVPAADVVLTTGQITTFGAITWL